VLSRGNEKVLLWSFEQTGCMQVDHHRKSNENWELHLLNNILEGNASSRAKDQVIRSSGERKKKSG